jgi:hypothetical protein
MLSKWADSGGVVAAGSEAGVWEEGVGDWVYQNAPPASDRRTSAHPSLDAVASGGNADGGEVLRTPSTLSSVGGVSVSFMFTAIRRLRPLFGSCSAPANARANALTLS